MSLLAMEQRDGKALARYFRQTAGPIPPNEFGSKSWFQVSVARYWQSTREQTQLALDNLLEVYKNSESWLAPVVGVFLSKLRQLSASDPNHLQICKTYLDSVFRFITITAKQQPLRQVQEHDSPLCLFIVVEQMKVYSALKQETAIRSLISKVVEQNNFPPLHLASLPTRVAYQYYVGRSLVLEDNAGEAVGPLEFALQHSPPFSKQRDLVLAYLVPAQLALGRCPKLDNNDSSFLGRLARHVASGNVDGVDQELELHLPVLCRFGTLPMFARCRLLCYRNLVKHALTIHRDTCAASEVNKFPIDSLLVPLVSKLDRQARGVNVLDYTLCVLANLIYVGLVKGYLSYEKLVLVVSNKDAFPKTTSFKNWS
ncbi:hypothetical protein BASA81_001304 [Batrachochytrium salamandrivorans]|nr:hypothetical protein BASA81_001304 [Batrachochytrium salamandrivorans]